MDLPSTTYIKGNKVRAVSGGMVMLIDAVKQEITLIDDAHKTFVTIPASQFAKSIAGAMPEMPSSPNEEVQALLAWTKPTVESRSTGRTDTIQGIQAAEHEITTIIEMPTTGDTPRMQMKIVVQVWIAKPEEVQRVPALRELAALSAWQQYFLDPMGTLPQLGQMGSAMAPLRDAMRQYGLVLRTRMEMFMPAASPGAPAGSQAAPKPVMQMSTELVELSSAPVDDALFQIPNDYAAADFGAIVKGAAQDAAQAAKAAPVKPAAPRPDGARAYVPSLSPVERVEPVYPAEARAQGVAGNVDLLATLDPQGNVTHVEALTGPEPLRQPAIDAVNRWKFRPVLRDGQPVIALTNPVVFFNLPARGPIPPPNFEEQTAKFERLGQLEREMPRSPQQVLADLEQDAVGRDEPHRFLALNGLAKAALEAGAADKASAYANELLAAAAHRKSEWNYADAIHDGHTVLGLLAVRQGDIEKAREHLLDSAQVEGSPVLNSFGPGMALAKALLDKGETVVVLQYFSLCRTFWKMGATKLDAWSEAVRNGKTPDFGVNSR
jgi:TonB family protein